MSDVVAGRTPTFIGGCEATEFDIDEVTDSGSSVLRLWTKMDELEWWDDDDVPDGLWDNSEYGTPTIADIKGDAANGFVNTVPWTVWDARFDQTWWEGGTLSRKQIVEQCTAAGVELLVVLRTVDDQGEPAWAPRPPMDAADLNEWWEHCFAIAYWLNVRNSFGVTHFQVLNEPDYSGQGWSPDGDQAGYVQMVAVASDAVRYATALAGLPAYLHAPVAANHAGGWIDYCLDNADGHIDVVDYHYYGSDIGSTVQTVQAQIAAHNPDGVSEPIWITEFGTLTGDYDTFAEAMGTANKLFDSAEAGAEGLTIFSLFSWPGLPGIIGPGHVETESYYAFRLMVRALNGGRDRLQHTTDLTSKVMAAADTTTIYLLAIDADATIACDVSALGTGPATATVYEYSSTNKDAIVATISVVGGGFDLPAPANALVVAEIPRSPLAVRWPR